MNVLGHFGKRGQKQPSYEDTGLLLAIQRESSTRIALSSHGIKQAHMAIIWNGVKDSCRGCYLLRINALASQLTSFGLQKSTVPSLEYETNLWRELYGNV